MSFFDQLRGIAAALDGNEALNSARFPDRDRLTFTLGDDEWEGVACNVQDPQRLKPDELGRLQVVATDRHLAVQDLRVLTLRRGETYPVEGATAPYDRGTLEILFWSAPAKFTGRRVGTCVWRQP